MPKEIKNNIHVKDDTELLINKGFKIIGSETSEEKKTIIILGVARGGTSLISGSLHYLGVFMGDEACEPVFEDSTLGKLISNKDVKEIVKTIKRYNKKYKIWGYKRPSTTEDLSYIIDKFRNPVFICVFRDIFSIANRNNISMKLDILKNLKNNIDEYKSIVKFLDERPHRSLLVSYEKCMRNKKLFINELCKFLSINPTVKQKAKCLSFISPNPANYLENSRITKCKGRLEKVERKTIGGWAVTPHKPDKPVQLNIFKNGKLIDKVIANRFRADLKKLGINSTGKAAFHLDFTKANYLQAGDTISVRAINDIRDINNSPIIFQ